MKYLNIIEKLSVLFDMLLDYKLSFVFLILLLAVTTLYTIKKIDTKKYILITLGSFAILFGINFISNYKVLTKTFDNFSTIFFSNIYFPSIYVYIFTLFTIDISLVISFLNKLTSKVCRIINSFVFVITHILFAIILNIVAENKIDIFEATSLYANINLVAVLELSINIFIIWILTLIVIYLANVLSARITIKKKNLSTTLNSNSVLEVSLPENNSEASSDSILEPSLANTFTPVETANTEIIENKEVKENSNSVYAVEVPLIVKEEEPKYIMKPEVLINNIVTEIKPEEVKEKISFTDILSGNIPLVDSPNSYSYNNINEVVNPEKIIEDIYATKKNNNINLQDIVSDISTDSNPSLNINDLIENKKQTVLDNLEINNISLSELSKEEESIVEPVIEVKEDTLKVEEATSDIVPEKKYTAKDYMKAMEMLEKITPYNKNANIKVSEAVAISLINNYSYDDCMMFKDILESCLAK